MKKATTKNTVVKFQIELIREPTPAEHVVLVASLIAQCEDVGYFTGSERCTLMPSRGRPKRVDDEMVENFRLKGRSLAWIAEKFGVTRGAIQASLKRTQQAFEKKE